MYDLIVIGGGPAGVTAALRGAELGAAVALIERGSLGGTCTNDGCVPTRVLAHAARLMIDARQYAGYGMAVSHRNWTSRACWRAPRPSSTKCTKRSSLSRTWRRRAWRSMPGW